MSKKELLKLSAHSMANDFIIWNITSILIMLTGFASMWINSIFIDHDPMPNEDLYLSLLSIMVVSIFFLKDIFNGRSPSKRKFKLQVIDNKTEKAASPIKCFIRNLTYFLYPIELFFLFKNPKKRLGDIIVGTRVEYIENPEKVKRKWFEYLIPIILAFLLFYLLFFPD